MHSPATIFHPCKAFLDGWHFFPTPLCNMQLIYSLLLSLPYRNWPWTPLLPLTSSNQSVIHPKALSLVHSRRTSRKPFRSQSAGFSGLQEATIPEHFGLHLQFSPNGRGYLHLPPSQRFSTVSPTSLTIIHLLSSSGWVAGLVINLVHAQFWPGLPTWEDDSLLF